MHNAYAYAIRPIMAEAGWRKGPWAIDEDNKLTEHIKLHGEGRWSYVCKISGLNRNGKSCRLRWINYLRPGLKRGDITPQEEGVIVELHALWGNKWSTIARYLPGRTDNEIKNYWRTHFKKEIKPSDKQEGKRSLQSHKKNEKLITTSSKAVMSAEDKVSKVSCSSVEVIDNQGMYIESEVGGLETEISKYDLLRYPSMDFQYYLSPTNLYQDDMSENDSTIEVHDLWEGLWNLEDDHPC